MKKYLIKSFFCFLLIFVVFVLPGCSLFDNDDNSSNNNIFYKDEVVTNSNGVQFSITNVDDAQQIGSTYLGDTTDNNFVIVTVKVFNNSNASVYVDSPQLTKQSNGAIYDSEVSLSIENQLYIYEEIGAGNTKSFNMVFETPTRTVDETYILKFEYGKSLFSTNNYIKFILKNKNGQTSNSGATQTNNIKNYYHTIGESFTFNGLEFTILDWGFYANYDKNNDIINVKMKVFNPSTTSVSIDKLSFVLIYNTDYKYNCIWDGTMEYIQWESLINPLETFNPCYCGYKTPEMINTAKEKLELRISLNSTTAKEFHYITLRDGI